MNNNKKMFSKKSFTFFKIGKLTNALNIMKMKKVKKPKRHTQTYAKKWMHSYSVHNVKLDILAHEIC